MNNVISSGNLGASQASPAVQSLAGNKASQGDNGSLFSTVLMQHVGPVSKATDGAENAATPVQNLSASELAKLIPTLLAQTKDSKSPIPVSDDSDNASDDENPALAMWIASMAAMQMQPNVPAVITQLNDLTPQSGGSAANQSTALQALEQQFPGLARALAINQSGEAKSQADKADVKADPKPAGVENSVAKTDSPNQAPDTKAEFEAALNAAQLAVPKKDDAQPAAHKNTDTTSETQKISPLADKSKVDLKGHIGAKQDIQPQQAQAVAKSQGQSQTTDNQTNSQAKKDSSSSNQGQHSANPVNGSASTTVVAGMAGATDQGNFAAMTQAAAHNSSANASSHVATPVASQPANIRDIGSVAATDPAPRIVPTARLMEAAGQAEMKVSVKSDSGAVDVRAILEGGNISATVAAEHGGTRDWMMSNMHELQNSLSRDDLNLKTFEVTDSGLQNSGQGGQPKQHEQQHQQRNSPGYSSFFETETQSSTASFDDMDSQETASQRALSLLA